MSNKRLLFIAVAIASVIPALAIAITLAMGFPQIALIVVVLLAVQMAALWKALNR